MFSVIICTGITCDRLKDPANGDVTLTGIKVGSTATYTCDEGYLLVGEDTRTCQSDMEWSGEAPICKRKNPRASTFIITLSHQ